MTKIFTIYIYKYLNNKKKDLNKIKIKDIINSNIFMHFLEILDFIL